MTDPRSELQGGGNQVQNVANYLSHTYDDWFKDTARAKRLLDNKGQSSMLQTSFNKMVNAMKANGLLRRRASLSTSPVGALWTVQRPLNGCVWSAYPANFA